MIAVKWDEDALERFWLWLEDQYIRYGRKTAEDLAKDIAAGIELIKKNPEAGQKSEKGTRVKTTSIRNYKIEYDFDPDAKEITILRVSK